MKVIKSVVLVSILCNFILLWFLNQANKDIEQRKAIMSLNKSMNSKNPSIYSSINFEQIFYYNNDSVFKKVWGEEFLNSPELAFLIATSYYYCIDKRNYEYLAISNKQLKDIYGKTIQVSKNNPR